MPKEPVLSPLAPAPVGPYSQAVKVGPLLFLSGQIPLDAAGNKVQGGVAKESQVVKTTVYLTDMADFKYMNQVYERYFTGTAPARTTVAVSKLPRESKVEIDAIAIIA
jgi:2-iminobutanoate/2-iminopropanoate deaminase